MSQYTEEIKDQACVVRFPREFPFWHLQDFAMAHGWRIVWRQPAPASHDNPRLYDAMPVSQYKTAKEMISPQEEEGEQSS